MEEAMEYFHSRPTESQIGAAVSPQSQPIPGREFLMKKRDELTKQVQDNKNKIQKPETWLVVDKKNF
jgi:pyridoxamine 5'-phosphate oxidase